MKQRRSGFSLVEVVIAVGVFALGVGTILGLLPGILREQEAAGATLTAVRMPDGIQSELRRIAGGNLEGLRAQLASDEALRLVADRGGSDLRVWSSGDEREQFFLVELFRFSEASGLGSMPAAVAVKARVSWPFRVGVGMGRVETPVGQRESVEFNLVLNR